MSERPFFTCPGGVWLRDAALQECTESAISLFEIVVKCTNSDWRIEVTGDHAFAVRQCIRNKTRYRRWSEERIHTALAELRARGCLLLATANGREWLEVPDRLCYCKGHRPEAELRPARQMEMALPPPEPMLLPPPLSAMRGDKSKIRCDVPRGHDGTAKDNDDDEDLASLPTEELKARLLSAGVRMPEEEEHWRAMCKKRGYSEDEASWRRWLVLAIERKPMPKKRRVEPVTPPRTGPVMTDEERARRSIELQEFRAGLRGGGT